MGRTNKLVDGCYSYWQGAVFPLLQRLAPEFLRQSPIPDAPSLSAPSPLAAAPSPTASDTGCSRSGGEAVPVASSTAAAAADATPAGLAGSAAAEAGGNSGAPVGALGFSVPLLPRGRARPPLEVALEASRDLLVRGGSHLLQFSGTSKGSLGFTGPPRQSTL